MNWPSAPTVSVRPRQPSPQPERLLRAGYAAVPYRGGGFSPVCPPPFARHATVLRQGRSVQLRGGVPVAVLSVFGLDRPERPVLAAQGHGVDPRTGHVELEADLFAQQPA